MNTLTITCLLLLIAGFTAVNGDDFPVISSWNDQRDGSATHIISRQGVTVVVIKEFRRAEGFVFGEKTTSTDGKFHASTYWLKKEGDEAGKTIQLATVDPSAGDIVMLVYVDQDLNVYRESVSRVIWEGMVAAKFSLK